MRRTTHQKKKSPWTGRKTPFARATFHDAPQKPERNLQGQATQPKMPFNVVRTSGAETLKT